MTLTREQIAQDRAYWTGELAGSVSESHSAFCNRMLAMCDAASKWMEPPSSGATHEPLSREQIERAREELLWYVTEGSENPVEALCDMALSYLDMVPRDVRKIWIAREPSWAGGKPFQNRTTFVSYSSENGCWENLLKVRFATKEEMIEAGWDIECCSLSSLPAIPKGET